MLLAYLSRAMEWSPVKGFAMPMRVVACSACSALAAQCGCGAASSVLCCPYVVHHDDNVPRRTLHQLVASGAHIGRALFQLGPKHVRHVQLAPPLVPVPESPK